MKQTKTIPFDWEEYNSNREKYKVVTRDGDDITHLKMSSIKSLYVHGSYVGNNDLQLQYEEEVVESWTNLYRTDNDLINTSATFITKEAAKSVGICMKGYIKTINLNDLI